MSCNVLCKSIFHKVYVLLLEQSFAVPNEWEDFHIIMNSEIICLPRNKIHRNTGIFHLYNAFVEKLMYHYEHFC